MFDQLFERPRALARHRAGPLVEERLRYLAHLARQGMAHATLSQAAVYTLIVADRLRLADRPGATIGLGEIERQAVRWANRPALAPEHRGSHRPRKLFRQHATRFLRFLGRLQLPAPGPRPHAAQIDAFADYLIRERGLSPRTREYYCPVVEAFLGDLGRAGHSLAELTAAQIDDALAARVTRGGYARRTVQGLTSALRSFFSPTGGAGAGPASPSRSGPRGSTPRSPSPADPPGTTSGGCSRPPRATTPRTSATGPS